MADKVGSRVAVDELTQAAFSGVLAALQERKLKPEQFPARFLSVSSPGRNCRSSKVKQGPALLVRVENAAVNACA